MKLSVKFYSGKIRIGAIIGLLIGAASVALVLIAISVLTQLRDAQRAANHIAEQSRAAQIVANRTAQHLLDVLDAQRVANCTATYGAPFTMQAQSVPHFLDQLKLEVKADRDVVQSDDADNPMKRAFDEGELAAAQDQLTCAIVITTSAASRDTTTTIRAGSAPQ